ncbi:MAG: ATP-binding protein, partial [Ignavibacteria bacterium]|nr:ATP-binding protein [Ignavibacteria bacterium]
AAYSILDNLLVWANSQRNNIDFAPKKQPFNDAINNNIILLENNANKKNIIISNELSEDLIANYDLPLISTVIRNLLANAIKFTPENGKIILKVEQDENQTLFSIKDTGIGIHPNRIEKLFDETIFETMPGTSDERGSGLGLKICKYFIEQHKGKIWVETEVGKGSEFKFSLPLKYD